MLPVDGNSGTSSSVRTGSFRTALLSPLFPCQAFADACANESSAGLGGYIRFPSGRQGCFVAKFSPAELRHMFDWFPSNANPQHYIATWELLAQLALLFCLTRLLPVGHLPIHVVFRTDNSRNLYLDFRPNWNVPACVLLPGSVRQSSPSMHLSPFVCPKVETTLVSHLDLRLLYPPENKKEAHAFVRFFACILSSRSGLVVAERG